MKINYKQMKSFFTSNVVILLILYFSCCNTPNRKPSEKTPSYKVEFLQKGEKITTATQKELLKNVSGAMQQGGPIYAIDFCNTRATELTDSLSQEFNCTIERISLKNRNPENFPDSETEMEQLKTYENLHKQGKELEPTTIDFNDRIEYYRPIIIGMETCLKCHGKIDNDLNEETKQALARLYPKDRATGYQMHDFRGLWKVSFNK